MCWSRRSVAPRSQNLGLALLRHDASRCRLTVYHSNKRGLHGSIFTCFNAKMEHFKIQPSGSVASRQRYVGMTIQPLSEGLVDAYFPASKIRELRCALLQWLRFSMQDRMRCEYTGKSIVQRVCLPKSASTDCMQVPMGRARLARDVRSRCCYDTKQTKKLLQQLIIISAANYRL